MGRDSNNKATTAESRLKTSLLTSNCQLTKDKTLIPMFVRAIITLLMGRKHTNLLSNALIKHVLKETITKNIIGSKQDSMKRFSCSIKEHYHGTA